MKNKDDLLNMSEKDKDKDKDKSISSILSNDEKDRFIYLSGSVDEDKAKDVIEKLLELQTADPMEEITMVINSGGGDIYSMFAITDMMDNIYTPIRTICLGTAQSAAAFIFTCGTKGRRFMTKHSSLMIHQVSGGAGGTTKDIDVQVREIKFLQNEMNEEITKRSDLSKNEIEKLIDRDFYIRPQQAIEYGLCDDIIKRIS